MKTDGMRRKLGRPRIKRDLRREAVVQTNVTRRHHSLFVEAARLEQTSLSQWTYQLLKKAVHEAQDDELRIRGSERALLHMRRGELRRPQ